MLSTPRLRRVRGRVQDRTASRRLRSAHRPPLVVNTNLFEISCAVTVRARAFAGFRGARCNAPLRCP